jgi:hypothetical protein
MTKKDEDTEQKFQEDKINALLKKLHSGNLSINEILAIEKELNIIAEANNAAHKKGFSNRHFK